jgi:hypothetical protein
MSIRLVLYGLGNGKDILPFKEQARQWKKENATWSTYMDENKSVSCFK